MATFLAVLEQFVRNNDSLANKLVVLVDVHHCSRDPCGVSLLVDTCLSLVDGQLETERPVRAAVLTVE